MPKKCEDPHERKRTHSLPEDAVNRLYSFFDEWEKELAAINIKDMPGVINFLTNMGAPAAIRVLEKVRSEQSGISHKQSVPNPQQ
jgi:hypothetical protein